MQLTPIEYLDYTWNPLAMRCTRVSPGCAGCWHLRTADRLCNNMALPEDERMALGGTGPFIMRERELKAPGRVKKPSVIGVQFMGDLFHDSVSDEFRDRIISNVVDNHHHDFILLTKREATIADYFSDERKRRGMIAGWLKGNLKKCYYDPDSYYLSTWPIKNIWHGLTVCNQSEADEKIPIFLQVPGKKFLSIEPMLSEINLKFIWETCPKCGSWEIYEPRGGTIYCDDCGADIAKPKVGIDAVILGGETGPGARPMHPDWVRSVRDQCATAGVPFFFKQWGGNPNGRPIIDRTPAVLAGYEPNMRNGGRLLDGRTHDELPWRES